MRATSLAVWIFLGMLAGDWCRATELVLTENGQANSVIVVADQPSPAAKTAANVLRDHIRAISGAELDIRSASAVQADRSARTQILVGLSPPASKLGFTAEGLGPGGICIGTAAGTLALFGPDDTTPSDPWGTLYAVTTFLEEHMGCRYLWLSTWPTSPGAAVGTGNGSAGNGTAKGAPELLSDRDGVPLPVELLQGRVPVPASGQTLSHRVAQDA